MVILFLVVYVGWLPEFGYHSPFSDPWGNFQAMIFPTLIVGYRLSAISSRMMRSMMLEVLRNDYVRTARAKGLAERTVLYRHALPNAVLPVITIMGAQLTGLLGGLLVIETIFSLPGVGRLTFDAVTLRDYTVVQGTVMVFAGPTSCEPGRGPLLCRDRSTHPLQLAVRARAGAKRSLNDQRRRGRIGGGDSAASGRAHRACSPARDGHGLPDPALAVGAASAFVIAALVCRRSLPR